MFNCYLNLSASKRCLILLESYCDSVADTVAEFGNAVITQA